MFPTLGNKLTAFVVVAVATVASGQATRPAIPTTHPAAAAASAARAGVYDGQPIQRNASAPGATATTQSAVDRLPSSQQEHPFRNPLEPQRVALALAAVIGLIVVMRFVAKKAFPSVAGAGRAAGTVRVLSRSPVSPKQQVLLVQVGKRVIVVGDCGTQMSALSEITDSDEVATLVGQIEAEKTPVAKTFGSLFGRARDRFEEPDAPADEESAEAKPPQELGLIAAQGEIRGLMEKVRGLAAQMKRS